MEQEIINAILFILLRQDGQLQDYEEKQWTAT